MNWLRVNWKNILLVASLAGNLLIIGMVGAHSFLDRPGHGGRIQAAGWSPLLPRGFFMELPRERRLELTQGLKSHANLFREGRGSVRRNAVLVADALIADPFDAAGLRAAVDGFSGEGKRMIDEGSRVALAMMEKLSPDERRLLAEAIRRRAGK